MEYPTTSGYYNNTTGTNAQIKSRVDSCFVPKCSSTSRKFPNKLFLTGPSDPKLRKKWFQAALRDDDYSPKTIIRCCEDHFDLENDVENWMKFKMFGGKLFLKKDVVPHIFECQNRMMPLKPRSAERERCKIFESIENTPDPSLECLLITETHGSQNVKISNDKSIQMLHGSAFNPNQNISTEYSEIKLEVEPLVEDEQLSPSISLESKPRTLPENVMEENIRLPSAEEIVSTEIKCRKELHAIQMENEKQIQINLKLKEKLLLEKIKFYQHRNT